MFELLLVCIVAFASYIIVSGQVLITGKHPPSAGRTMSWVYSMIHEISALALLWYVLRRRSKTFYDLGLRATPMDVAFGPVLWLGAVAAYYISYPLIYRLAAMPSGYIPRRPDVGSILFAGGVPVMAFLFQFLNPFFEELIVRAYVMTEVKNLTGSVAFAVFASTLLQTSYHFYQGIPLALSEMWGFLLFSIYYAKTNRIAAPILAHLAMDIIATLRYAGKIGHGG